MVFQRRPSRQPTPTRVLPGRETAIVVAATHAVHGTPMQAPWPEGAELAMFGLGCFWGAERKFWQCPGVISTQAGYAAGVTVNPNYYEVCSGQTGHNEVVQVVYDPQKVSYEELLKIFWESHNPTQGMRQGNDQGTQYRSGIYTHGEAQHSAAQTTKAAFGKELASSGFGPITTEIIEAPVFYYAEDEHQQYLYKQPGGYCGLGGPGVSCPIGLLT
jgi:peptide-methionine (S)-S-oxide reductase